MNFSENIEKNVVFTQVEKEITGLGFQIATQDQSRPWGGFFVLNEEQAPEFIKTYFPHLSINDFAPGQKLSPKILVVAPHKRLSWQYHFRRAEIWKVVGGIAGVVTSDTDEQNDVQTLALGTIINLKQGERHRLIGLDQWGIIAEIWQHTDPENPSDENDIVRVQDDFGR
ncbi:phosphoheptose isomerase [Emticicia sp. 17c]|uniref:phosphoheptose isomerase n=1 Tax=Emticicia sp. 17c TaxID=3127704 RepID=UPI00301CD116